MKNSVCPKSKKLELIDYRNFSLSKLHSEEFGYLWYILYWPLFGLMFLAVERIFIRESYTPIYCPLDDLIPFCEIFLIPYLFWFVYLVGMHIYALLFDKDAFVRLMRFIIVSYTVSMVIYIIFPNCQELRPVSFERDNIFTRFLAGFYNFDTNTNVCPSIHVIGSLAVLYSSWNSKLFSGRAMRVVFTVIAVLISISTVFLKQHSIIDIFAAIPVCLLAGFVTSLMGKKDKKSVSECVETGI